MVKILGGSLKSRKVKEYINKEFWGMAIMLFSAFALFCLITGDGVFHPFGGILQKFFLGVFGFFGYAVFILTFFSGLTLLTGKKIAKGRIKSVALSLFSILFFAFCIMQLATNPIKGTLGEYLKVAFNSASEGVKNSTFGGIMFSLFVYLISKAISVVGAYILFSLIIAFCLYVCFKDKINLTGKEQPKNANISLNQLNQQVQSIPQGNVNYNSEPVNNTTQNYNVGARNKKTLVVGDNTFGLKDARDISLDNYQNDKIDILTPRKSSQSVYSEEYDRDLRDKMNYIKSSQKITPENINETYKPEKANVRTDEEFFNQYDGGIDESSPSDDIYIPENYKKAVTDNPPDINNAYNEDCVQEEEIEVPDILDGLDNTASDDDIINMSEIESESSLFGEYNGFSEKKAEKEDEKHVEEIKPRKTESIKPAFKTNADFVKKAVEKEQVESKEEEINPFDEMPLDFKYKVPSIDIFKSYTSNEDYGKLEYFKREKAAKIMNTLKLLAGVEVQVVNIVHGPTITRFDLAIPENVSIKNITRYTEDLQFRLESKNDIRFATVPGTPYIGVEVPNETKSMVGIRDVLESDVFKNAKKSSLTFVIGKNIIGEPVVADITKMPHLMIAGSTGTGKSVGLNTLLVSLMMKYSPQELRFIIVDPKQVEFTVFNGIPHMMFNEILCDAQKTVAMLNWAVKEMEARYTKLKNAYVHNIEEYNDQIDPRKEPKMPRIVIIVDEFADLMSVDKKNIEDKIARIAQKARAAGLYLILATQRPDVKIVEGSIKTNFTSRMAFKMSNAIDSATILGEAGAEKLLGAGDLLYRTSTMTNVERAQGAYVDMSEIKAFVQYIKENNQCYFNDLALKSINEECEPQIENVTGKTTGAPTGKVPDEYIDALRIAVNLGYISISLIERKMSFGFPKAAKIYDWMENEGYVLPNQTGKQKQVSLTKEQFEEIYGEL